MTPRNLRRVLARARGGLAVPVVTPAPPVTPAPSPMLGLQRYIDAGMNSEGQALYADFAAAQAAEWPGYQGQSVAGRTTTVTSRATFKSAIEAIVPDGVSWYEVVADTGADWLTYQVVNIAIGQDFGSGGLLIRSATGKTIEMNMCITFLRGGQGNAGGGRGIHIKGIRFTTELADPFFTIGQVVPGDTVTALTNMPRLRIEDCEFGRMYVAGQTDADYATWNCPIKFFRADEVQIINCKFYGVQGAARAYSVKYFRFEGNDIRNCIGDDLQMCGKFKNGSVMYADSIYGGAHRQIHIVRNNTHRDPWDRTDLIPSANDIPHSDLVQIVTGGCTFAEEDNITWDLLLEDNVGRHNVLSSHFSTYTGANRNRCVQLTPFQTSHDLRQRVIAGFNVMGSALEGYKFGGRSGSRGWCIQNVQTGPGVRPAAVSDARDFFATKIEAGGNTIVQARRNIIGLAGSVTGSATLDETGSIYSDFNNQTDPNRPPLIFTGTYAGFTDLTWAYTLSGVTDQATFRTAMRNQHAYVGGGTSYGYRAPS